MSDFEDADLIRHVSGDAPPDLARRIDEAARKDPEIREAITFVGMEFLGGGDNTVVAHDRAEFVQDGGVHHGATVHFMLLLRKREAQGAVWSQRKAAAVPACWRRAPAPTAKEDATPGHERGQGVRVYHRWLHLAE